MAEEPRFPLEKVGPSAMHSVISDAHVAGNDKSDLNPRGCGRGDFCGATHMSRPKTDRILISAAAAAEISLTRMSPEMTNQI